METANHEYYVSLEVAKLLKQAGFNLECHASYQNGGFTEFRYSSYFQVLVMDFNSAPNYMNQYSAPTLDVAQRWLREEKGIYIEITAIENKRAVTNSDGWTFHYEYSKPKFDCYIQDERCEDMCTLYDSFDTYEEALEAGIKKALELILEKGE